MLSPLEFIKKFSFLPEDQQKDLAKDLSVKYGYNLYEALWPIDPRLVKRTQLEPTEEELKWFEEWIKVKNSVEDDMFSNVDTHVWDSVNQTIYSSCWNSIYKSLTDSIKIFTLPLTNDPKMGLMFDFVNAYVSSLFPNIKKWRGVDHEEGVNPFQSGINLWKSGLIYSIHEHHHTIHSGPKLKLVYEKMI